MAGSFSGRLVDSYNRTMSTSGNMSFNPDMHGAGTPGNQSFSLFSETSSVFNESTSESAMLRNARLQEKLNQKLGPEYISQRPGGGGMRLTYAEGWKMINLANEVFGFNGWSTSVVNLTVDFMDPSEGGSKWNICVTAMVRVTLRDGVFHEDVGCGTIENVKSKAQGLDKCKKEAVTDAVKRTLRNFGNLLGNCLYDKTYTNEIVKIKVPPAKFDKSQLHRRPEFQESNAGASTSTSTVSVSLNNSHSTKPAPPNQWQPHPQQRVNQAPPVQVKTEVKAEPQVTSFAQPTRAVPVQDSRGGAPQRPPGHSRMPPPPNPNPRPQTSLPNANTDRRVSFVQQNATASSSTAGTSPTGMDISESNDFGFSDDDDLFANVNLEDIGRPIEVDGDVGPPIAEEADMGRPLHFDEPPEPVSRPTNHQPHAAPLRKPPSNSSSSSSARASRLEAILAAQAEAEQSSGPSSNNPQPTGRLTLQSNTVHRSLATKTSNENMNLNEGQMGNQGASFGKRSSTPAMGGFQFPPGMANPLQASSGPGGGIGMKRPIDMMNAVSTPRGTTPGMGLQEPPQHSLNGRQVLGRLDNGDGGDAKRLRR